MWDSCVWSLFDLTFIWPVMLTANHLLLLQDGTGRMLSSMFRIFYCDVDGPPPFTYGPSYLRVPPFGRKIMDPASAWHVWDLAGPPAHQEPVGFPPGPFKTVLLLNTYSSCFNSTIFGRKAGITRARMNRMSDNLSGVWVQRKYSVSNSMDKN